MKIIIADDNRDNLYILSTLLSEYKHLIDTVKNGRDLIEMIQKDKYDLIFMDIEMPVMNGVTAVKHIRDGNAGAHNTDIPVIAMTAHPKSTTNNYFSMGFSEVLSKPINFETLYDLIERYSKLWNRPA